MAQRGPVISHWHTLVDRFSTSALDFYTAVEQAVRAREVPKVRFSRVAFREGGFGSAKRIYLRVRRGSVAFDLGAAPYGTGYFFSWWMTKPGPKYRVLYLIGLLAAIGAGTTLLSYSLRTKYSYFVVAPASLLAITALLGILARNGVFGSEEHILAIPVLGWVYERVYNPVTYHTLDTAMMFQESVRRAVNEVIEELLTGQGLRALSDEERKPTIRDLTW